MVFADRGEIISGGNFHGEYPAKVMDYLAIGVHEIASMSERRIERLVNPGRSRETNMERVWHISLPNSFSNVFERSKIKLPLQKNLFLSLDPAMMVELIGLII